VNISQLKLRGEKFDDDDDDNTTTTTTTTTNNNNNKVLELLTGTKKNRKN